MQEEKQESQTEHSDDGEFDRFRNLTKRLLEVKVVTNEKGEEAGEDLSGAPDKDDESRGE